MGTLKTTYAMIGGFGALVLTPVNREKMVDKARSTNFATSITLPGTNNPTIDVTTFIPPRKKVHDLKYMK